MMVPHYKVIIEVFLFSFGFKSSRSLSAKLVNLYDLADKQLSKQVRGCLSPNTYSQVYKGDSDTGPPLESAGPGQL